ncbi:MAG: LCP family protein [Lawsonibacter sp.]|nr:LCP family protein [Lawsonibacter sp.]
MAPRTSGRGRTQSRPSGRPRARARRRSPVRALFLGLYKLLVVVSVVIVVGFAAFQFLIKPPAQTPVKVPAQVGTKGTDPVADPSGGAVVPAGLTRRDGVYNILLAATDKEGFRTDTMMVMCYDIPNQKVGVVSVPRDTLTRREAGKNPKLVYGPGGVEQRVEDISNMLGVPIDYYIKVNIQGFIALVDYLDGVDFYVPDDMDYDDPFQDLHIHYKQGQYHLNGQQAMEVARFRKNNDLSGYSDVGRTQTQQKLLVALAKKVLDWGSLTKINGFVEIFNQYVDTDLALNDMMYFASQAVYMDISTGVETATLEGRGDGVYRGNTWCYVLDQAMTLDTVNRLINPFDQALTLEDMDLLQAESYTQG